MKTITLSALMLVVSAHAGDFRSVSERNVTVKRACQPTEKWTIEGGAAPQWMARYQDFVQGKVSPVSGFAEAVSLKRISALLNSNKAEFEKDFSEFWVGRILFELNLDPLAHEVFASVLEYSDHKQIRKSAFACMALIQRRSPDWKVPADSVEWGGFDFTEEDADVIYMASLIRPTKLTPLLPAGYRDFYKGTEAMKGRKYSEAAGHFQKFLAFLDTPKMVTQWEKYRDTAHLMLARAYYSTAKFPEASAQFQKVKKTSNLQIETLSNLAWSYLLQEQYDAAIGVSMQIRTGSLRNAFAPEPIMVAAMALNELCMFQDSIRTIQAFINDYGTSFEWLNRNKSKKDLYPEVIRFIKDPKATGIPMKVGTEWLRSPGFLSRQLELNRLIDHPKKLVDVQRKGYQEQMKLTSEFLAKTNDFIKKVQVAKLKLKPGEELSKELSEQYLNNKRELRRLVRYYRSSKIWKNLSRKYEKRIPTYRKMVVEQVNKDLFAVNKQLLQTLNNVRENSDWIEVEIYNGASQDLVWKEAHPDFDKVSKEIDTAIEEEAPASQVWSWGRFQGAEIEQAEIWEDEVGALKADIRNECDKKNKYLKLKLSKRRKS